MKNRTFAVASILLCLAARSVCASNDGFVDLGNGFAAEAITSIGTDDMWRTADPTLLRSKAGLIVQFWPENEESQEQRGSWNAVGFALAGVGDIGEKPVAVRLWSREQVSYSSSASKSYQARRGKAALFFYRSCKTAVPCQKEIVAVVFRLESGEQVFMNNKQLGSIDLVPD